MNYKLFISLLIGSLLVLIGVAQLLVVNYAQDLYAKGAEERITDQAMLTSERVGSAIKLDFDSRLRELKMLSALPEVSSGTTEECNEKVKDTYDVLKPRISNIFRINNKYITDCNLLEAAIGFDSSNSSSILAMFASNSSEPSLSNLSYSPVSGKYLLSIYLPQMKDGKVDSIVGFVMYLDQIQDNHLSVSAISGGYVTVADDTYTILYNPVPKYIGLNWKSETVQQALGKEDTETIARLIDAIDNNKKVIVRYTKEGASTVTASAPVEVFPGRRWLISTAVPIEAAIPESPFTILSVSLGIILVVSMLALLFFLIHRLIRPIENITRTIEQISIGDYTVEIDENIRKEENEIGRLATAFDRTIVSLKLAMKQTSKETTTKDISKDASK